MDTQPLTPSAVAFSPIAERPSTLVHADRLIELLPAWLKSWQIQCVAETASTNTDLLQFGRLESMQHISIVPRVRQADLQTAGRGRLGRQWLSQQNDSLMFSISLQLPLALANLSGLSLVCGVALVDAISKHFKQAHGSAEPKELGLKWPNDVLWQGRKLAGILLESLTITSESTLVVIGIGLNLRRNLKLEQQIGRGLAGVEELLPWAGQGTTAALDVTALFAEIIQQLALRLDEFAHHGFASSRERWLALDAYVGQTVNLLEDQIVKYHGRACGVDEKGYLRLATADGLIAIMGGELSLRSDDALKSSKPSI